MRAEPQDRIGVIIELRSVAGIRAARSDLASAIAEATDGRERVAVNVDSPYVTVALTAAEILRLVQIDSAPAADGQAPVAPGTSARPGTPGRAADAEASPRSAAPTGTAPADNAAAGPADAGPADAGPADAGPADAAPAGASLPGSSGPRPPAARRDDPAATALRAPRRSIQRLWPNFEIGGLLLRSVVATKCRAAQRTFDASGEGIVWAVLDSGIDGEHVHFRHAGNTDLPDGLEPRSFVPEVSDPLVDENGHGTHVAAIIAGGLAPGESASGVGWYLDASGNEQRAAMPVDGIRGMAPAAKLLACTVLRPDRTGDVTALLDALLYIQQLNDQGRNLRVHGVNISVGHMFDPRWFAAGLTPVCREVDRLVASGVVVVVAAGNTGYGYAKDPEGRPMRLGFGMTINDPGNAQRAITVGATSSTPHTSGVSYFSSKGPTGDGRLKPDLVAPGERIISAAAGELRRQAQKADPSAQYIESSGTSMAAPHVAGAAAGLLSVHRELIGRPDEVKRLLMSSATDLGRDSTFQGAGMLDAMRALQSH